MIPSLRRHTPSLFRPGTRKADIRMDSLMTKKKSGVFGETLRTVVYAVLIAIGIRIFAYEPCPSNSGKPKGIE